MVVDFVLDLVDVDVAVHDGVDGKGADTLHAELLHDVLTMGNDGGQTDMQTVGNLFVDISLYDERHDLDLTVGENLTGEDVGHRREVLTMAVGMLLEHEQRTHQVGLGHIDAEAVELYHVI